MARRKKPDALDQALAAAELRDKEAERDAAPAGSDRRAELDALLAAARDDLLVGPRGASALAQFSDRDSAGRITDFWAEQANWNRRTGETPLEFLTRVYRNPLVDMEQRIRAAASARDLVHKHLPNLTIALPDDQRAARTTGVRERLVERLMGLSREPEASLPGGAGSGKASDRKAKR